uniref:Reverse transcriptase RNase H-like domain-containing protein n=1 Tax=Ditylenchus dipsaci TaxID=166011 RepID=A0A915ESJ4_9BILA
MTENLKLKINKGDFPSATAANNTLIQFLGSANMEIKLGTPLVKMPILVVNKNFPASFLLGTDLISELNEQDLDLSINFLQGELIIGDRKIPMTASIQMTSSRKVIAKIGGKTPTNLRKTSQKNCIITNLIGPQFDRRFIIETDASASVFACALLQEGDDHKKHSIAYSSSTLNSAESKYCSIESEGLAVVFALKNYHHYLAGSPFRTLIRTDNSSICSLLKRRDLTGKLAIYQLIIQAYNVELVHRSNSGYQVKVFTWSNEDVLSWLQQASVCVITRESQGMSLSLQSSRHPDDQKPSSFPLNGKTNKRFSEGFNK